MAVMITHLPKSVHLYTRGEEWGGEGGQKPVLGFVHASWKAPHGNISSFLTNVLLSVIVESIDILALFNVGKPFSKIAFVAGTTKISSFT